MNEVMFRYVRDAAQALWDLCGRITPAPSIHPDEWILAAREGIRGFYARVLTVDEEYDRLRARLANELDNLSPNHAGVVIEQHVATMLFGMDSAIECFVFAMNAFGYAKAPAAFANVEDVKMLARIKPDNIATSKPGVKPVPGYAIEFPNLVACFQKHLPFIEIITTLHDVSKHRSAVTNGGNADDIYVRESPKQPRQHMSSTTHTLASIMSGFQETIDDLALVGTRDVAKAFGFVVEVGVAS